MDILEPRPKILKVEVRFKPNCVIEGLIHREFEQIYWILKPLSNLIHDRNLITWSD